MSDDQARVTAEVRDKIKSKMEVAKFFTGFVTLLIGILLKEGTLSSYSSKFGVVFFVWSLGFCVAAMFAFDHMLWPKRFWLRFKNESTSELSFQDGLKTEMLRSWWWLFVPAVAFFGIGLVFSLVQKLGLQSWCPSPPASVDFYLLVAFILAFVVPIVLGVAKWPRVKKSFAGKISDISPTKNSRKANED